MRTRVLAFVAALLACGCAVVAPKSRLEPHERVAVQIRGATSGARAARGGDAFEQAVRGALDRGSDSVAALNAALGPLVDEREFQARFAAVVSTELSRRRTVEPTPERADAVLALRLHSLEVQQHGGDRVSLRITAAARIESGGEDPGKARTAWRASEYESPARPYREWIETDGGALVEDINAAFGHIADEVVATSLRAGVRP